MTLSAYARRTMKTIAKGNRANPHRFHRAADGKFYLPNGKPLTAGTGLHELVEAGVFKSAGDGLFPEHPQTFVFDGAGFAQQT